MGGTEAQNAGRAYVLALMVAACSQVRIDYTSLVYPDALTWVAACSQVRIDYTSDASARNCSTVAACSQVRIDYTTESTSPGAVTLRLALR